MIVRLLQILLPVIFGLIFFHFGLNWGKDDSFNESNVEELIKSGIKTKAFIMNNSKERVHLIPKIGNVHYYFPLSKNLYSGDGIDSVSMKNVTEVIYLSGKPYVNCINTKENISNLLENKVTARYNYYFIVFGILLFGLGINLVIKKFH